MGEKLFLHKEMLNPPNFGHNSGKADEGTSEPFNPMCPVEYKLFGCVNCLYREIECKDGKLYKPAKAYDGSPSCKSYVYYD